MIHHMDNDDYRWGKLTNHKVFGEDMVVLTGDVVKIIAYGINFRQSIFR